MTEAGTTLSRRSGFYIDISIGLTDGLMMSFVVISGLIQLATASVISVVVLIMCALGGLAMGLSRFYSAPDLPGHDHHHHGEDEERDQEDEAHWEEEAKALTDPRISRISAWNIGCSYTVGGLIPLLSVLLFKESEDVYLFTMLFTFAALCVLGIAKSSFLGRPPLIPTLRLLILCAAAAGGAWVIGGVFK